MEINKFLNGIKVWSEDETVIKDFLCVYEKEISDFVRNKWSEYEDAKKNPNKKPNTDVLTITKNSNGEPNAVMEAKKGNSKKEEISQTELFTKTLNSKHIALQNGKVNQAYSFNFKENNIGMPEISEFSFEGLETIGLFYEPIEGKIEGIPNNAGEHAIVLKLKRKDWEEGKPIFERKLTIIINPDPRTLWKNLPTPSDVEYYKPDSDKSFVKVESTTSHFGIKKHTRKDIVAASQRGRSHAQEGRPRDDDFALKYLNENEWYIMTVADGAGSAKSSRKGSEIVCKTVIEVCKKMIIENLKVFEHQIKEFNTDRSDSKRKYLGDFLYKILGSAFIKSLKNIEDEAKQSNKPIKDFSTTLIVSICKKFKFGWFVGAFWVGDGGIGIYNKETRFLKVLGESDGGEYAGQTRFITMPEIAQPAELYRRLRFEIVDDFTALILMTDGITDPKFETDANLSKIERWDELWQDLSKEVDFSADNEASADQLLSWLDFWSPGNHDDRTIAILF